MLTHPFDFILGIGENCACTFFLRKHALQDASYPFDWLTNASFQTRIDLLCNHFDGFLNKADFKPLKKNPNVPLDEKHDYYENTRTKFYFYHDFPVGQSFEEAFSNVAQKYTRRIKRMYANIDQAKRVLLVFCSREGVLSKETLLLALNKLQQTYKAKTFSLLILENNPALPTPKYEQISAHILKVTYPLADKDHPEYTGNIENTDKIIAQIKRNPKEKASLPFFVKVRSVFFLSKQKRRAFRAKYENTQWK